MYHQNDFRAVDYQKIEIEHINYYDLATKLVRWIPE